LDEKEVISNSADTWMPSASSGRQKQQKALNFVIVSNFSVIIITVTVEKQTGIHIIMGLLRIRSVRRL